MSSARAMQRVVPTAAAVAALLLDLAQPADAMHGNLTTLHVREQFPAMWPPAAVVLVACSGSLALLALLWVVSRRRYKMSLFLGAAAGAALVSVGVVSWAVTYIKARDLIQERTEQLLLRAAEVGESYIESQFVAGISVLTLIQEAVSAGHFGMSNTYPASHLYMAWIMHNLKSDFIELIYYGTAPGTSTALSALVGAGRAGEDAPELAYLMFGQFFYPGATPPFVACAALDRNSTPAQCAAHTCGRTPRDDFACQATCAEATNGSLQPYAAPEYCTVLPHEGAMLTIFPAVYSAQLGASLSALDGGVGPPAAHVPYDPTSRPWWTEDSQPSFTPPYKFATGLFGVGITLAGGCYDDRGAFRGTAAVDFTLSSLHPLLKALAPTPNTHMYIVDLDGNFIAATLTAVQLAADTGFGDDQVVVLQDISNEDSAVKAAFDVILARYDGTLEAAWQHQSTLHVGGYIYMARPIDAVHQRYLLVLTLPYSDAMGAADDASVIALIITMSVSLTASALMFMLVTVFLTPLKNLEQHMYNVACMNLDIAYPRLSRVREVSNMQVSFRVMVATLNGYRDFLPQSVLVRGDRTTSSPRACSMDNLGQLEASEIQIASSSVCESVPSSTNSTAAPTTLSDTGAQTAVAARHEVTGMFTVNVSGRHLTVVNVTFHGVFQPTALDPTLVALHSAGTAAVLDAVRDSKGVVDGMNGDTVTVLFNAHLPLVNHRYNALSCTLRINENLLGGRCLPASCGVRSGFAKVGNMGCTGLKKFNVLGPVPKHAYWYAQLAAQWMLPVVASENVTRECAEFFESRHILKVVFADSTREDVVSEVLCCRQLEQQEWMYELAAASKSPYRKLDEAFRLMYVAPLHDAREVLTRMDTAGLPADVMVHYSHLARSIDSMIEHGEPPRPVIVGISGNRVNRHLLPFIRPDPHLSGGGSDYVVNGERVGQPAVQRSSDMVLFRDVSSSSVNETNPLAPQRQTSPQLSVHDANADMHQD